MGVVPKRSKVPLVLAALGGVGFVAFAACALLIRVYRVPSGSMIPTVGVSDRVFVRRTSGVPKRGDVIVFALPEHPEQQFIKRVVVMPGEKLEVKSGHPYVNDWEVPSCLVGAASYDDEAGAGGRHDGDLFVEFLGDAAYFVFVDHASFGAEHQGPYRAKAGEVWVLGDNRNNSHDSRMWFAGQGGGLPFENLRGRVMGRAALSLPASMASLQPKVDECLRTRPKVTTPPAP